MSKPDLKNGNVQFHATGASGYSNKSFITKAGGANGVLRISIVDNQLYFWASPVFYFFGKLYDLIQKIPISNITEVTVENRSVSISFDSSHGTKEFVIRRMNKQDEFLEILDKLRHKKRAGL